MPKRWHTLNTLQPNSRKVCSPQKPGEIPVSAYRHTIESIEENGLYIVLEVDDMLAGHLLLEPLPLSSSRHVVALTIVVHPGNTGKGYGRKLMEYAVEWAREAHHVEKIELRVRSTNPRAIALYESLGFEVEGCLRERVKLQRGYADDICMSLFVKTSAVQQ